MGLIGEHFDPGFVGRMREDGYESRSGSDNFEVASGDDQDAAGDGPRKKKKYHRQTPLQIQELESFFKECPHPDEKQRTELSRRLGLEGKQIKFWFQNRRTQMKTQLERHENVILRQENDKLRAENDLLKQAMSTPVCNGCGGPAVPGEISYEQHQLRIENARLKDELSRICALTNKGTDGCATIDVLSSGTGGTRDNELLVIDAEFQVLSPLVLVRQVRFIRFCKQHSEGVWAVVDVSINATKVLQMHRCSQAAGGFPLAVLSKTLIISAPRLHGWLATLQRQCDCMAILMSQDVPGEDNTGITPAGKKSLLKLAQRMTYNFCSGVCASSVHKWEKLSVGYMGRTLGRQCDCMAILMSQDVPGEDDTGITPVGKKSLLKLAQRMTYNFCSGVCASSVHKREKLSVGNVGEDVRVMTRKSINDPGEPHGVVLSAATSVWMSITQERLFDFLRDERMRCEWDILSYDGPIQEMVHVAKGMEHSNCVSLLRGSVSTL
ncbi:hypothetical protein V6N13_108863 [Hibiscus sabdariffa]